MQRQHPKLSGYKFLTFASIPIAYFLKHIRKTVLLNKISITRHDNQREYAFIQGGNEGRGRLHMITHSGKNSFEELLQVALRKQTLLHILQYL